MKVMVSACLTGENCKYNGGNNRNEKVLRLMADNDVITVCPEQMGGLPTPRVPAEIKDGVVTAGDGRSVDAQFRNGAAKCLRIAVREQPDLIVLQSRSPSCGVKQRYDGTFSGTVVDGAGVTKTEHRRTCFAERVPLRGNLYSGRCEGSAQRYRGAPGTADLLR